MRMVMIAIVLSVTIGCGRKDTAEPSSGVPIKTDSQVQATATPVTTDVAVSNTSKPTPPKQTSEPIPAPSPEPSQKAVSKEERKIWDREEFKTWTQRTLRPGKTPISLDSASYFAGNAGPEAVLANLGKPDETTESGNYTYWIYRNRTKDQLTGKIDSSAIITFWRGYSGGSAQVVKEVSFR